MASFCFGGKVLMKPEIEEEKEEFCGYCEDYPFKEPIIYLEGDGEEYFPQFNFSWAKDSIVAIRETKVVRYSRSDFTELLAKDEEGEIIWVDGRSAPYSGCWGGQYLGETRDASVYNVEEYDFSTGKKRKYKMQLEDESEIDDNDCLIIKSYVDIDLLKNKGDDKDIDQTKDSSEFVGIDGNPF